MWKMFIDKKVEINAPSSKVWDVITKNEYTKEWTSWFGSDVTVVSDWKLDSPVLWKTPDWKVDVEGNVTKVEPWKFLRYTVFDVGSGRYDVDEDDGVTFELSEKEGKTQLHMMHGDFWIMADGKKYYDMTEKSWDIILPKIKELAEK
ncbi:MAG: hypothetical protein ACD_3C00205G0010 [uncultured bacterium (gcode 4)]|uniref:Activator of Hsp90 ATPase homologue 1/2-like C-terminal domain-containing protein n=1 Tax=uncultured bacterium (gcode 4) TaxID=1234023 RepID=K2FZX5_9BACT|nr:MAG: hypothetical protein ACD_3C00205G0010 [uncultured bacterium (gcode 4)]